MNEKAEVFSPFAPSQEHLYWSDWRRVQPPEKPVFPGFPTDQSQDVFGLYAPQAVLSHWLVLKEDEQDRFVDFDSIWLGDSTILNLQQWASLRKLGRWGEIFTTWTGYIFNTSPYIFRWRRQVDTTLRLGVFILCRSFLLHKKQGNRWSSKSIKIAWNKAKGRKLKIVLWEAPKIGSGGLTVSPSPMHATCMFAKRQRVDPVLRC